MFLFVSLSKNYFGRIWVVIIYENIKSNYFFFS